MKSLAFNTTRSVLGVHFINYSVYAWIFLDVVLCGVLLSMITGWLEKLIKIMILCSNQKVMIDRYVHCMRF